MTFMKAVGIALVFGLAHLADKAIFSAAQQAPAVAPSLADLNSTELATMLVARGHAGGLVVSLPPQLQSSLTDPHRHGL